MTHAATARHCCSGLAAEWGRQEQHARVRSEIDCFCGGVVVTTRWSIHKKGNSNFEIQKNEPHNFSL